MIRQYLGRFFVIGGLIALGLLSGLLDWFDAESMVVWARAQVHHWWLVLLIILFQSVLFTFALAGSVFLWVVALLYPPLMAAVILAAGSTIGGLGAYYLSGYLTGNMRNRIEKSRIYQLMHGSQSFLTLFALRVCPGFPHSLINYSAGILRVNLMYFWVSAVLGISIKSYLYARVIYPTATGVNIELLLDLAVLGPLGGLLLLSVMGICLGYRHKG